MLIPNRFANLRISLINISALTIEFLISKKRKSATIREVLAHLSKMSQELDREDVVYITMFLFAIGKAEYSTADDMITLTI
ncbi:hypothetical protein [bacterium endosymbiont of Bathymodiolus sp. 5 South]|jgi:hypothetical protein|uniref:hypothetical protein n=1 Tax=bacterium endosymbiont of Bathymodiolus sp. 5 South TaxID=1181670 RepID=UPI001118CF65|nr:hypothetical protein [bacterium endosymbiont of Bathymodiolus sp. 5 South]VVH62599.1 hypothetical protein BSPWISOX_460 [uncultured Gammaproteobacteria bacterium]VVH65970.1 hypothetical protein BSPLISOX_347 [uncultured Gammaproteobacteria bacterium]